MRLLALVALFIALSTSTLVPTHVLLTLTGDSSSLQVSFCTSSQPTNPSVTFWNAGSSNTTEITTAQVFNFTHPTSLVVDYITSITISPLEPNTNYMYYVSGESNNASTYSPTYSTFTLPEDNDTISIGIYGDMGAYGSAILETGPGGLPYWSANRLFDFIIHNGDLAYNLDSNDGNTGIEFMNNIQVITATTPYVVTPGNHEFHGVSETYYNNWFVGQTLLGKNAKSGDPTMYYSFDIGTKIHIIVISTEVYCEDYPNLVPQWQWLVKDLTEVRSRSIQPWIFALGHRQIYLNTTSSLHARLMRLGLQCNDSSLAYCNYTQACKNGQNCAYSIEELFDQYNVDMYFAGHAHTYNRMYPISSDLTYETQDNTTYVNPQHPVYVVSGAAGTESTPPTAPPTEAISQPLASGPTVVSINGYSFSLLQVFNYTHVRLIQNEVETGNSLDEFWIIKDPSRAPWKETTSLPLSTDTEVVCDQ